jgi:hypothetical protein
MGQGLLRVWPPSGGTGIKISFYIQKASPLATAPSFCRLDVILTLQRQLTFSAIFLIPTRTDISFVVTP